MSSFLLYSQILIVNFIVLIHHILFEAIIFIIVSIVIKCYDLQIMILIYHCLIYSSFIVITLLIHVNINRLVSYLLIICSILVTFQMYKVYGLIFRASFLKVNNQNEVFMISLLLF